MRKKLKITQKSIDSMPMTFLGSSESLLWTLNSRLHDNILGSKIITIVHYYVYKFSYSTFKIGTHRNLKSIHMTHTHI